MSTGKPVLLEIHGEDHLRSQHSDLMLESAATSLQVHLKVPPRLSVRYYNASLIASALTVALAAPSDRRALLNLSMSEVSI